MTTDYEIRLAAFKWLNEQENLYGDVLPRTLLEDGFIYKDQKITLLGPKGIWKPKLMEFPLSITTSVDSPYNDTINNDVFLKYSYRGIDPQHPDNVGLREAMKQKLPLIYFFAIEKGRYMVTKPVFIIGDNTSNLFFNVALDDETLLFKSDHKELLSVEEDPAINDQFANETIGL